MDQAEPQHVKCTVLQINTTSPTVIAVTATCTLADVMLADFQKPAYEAKVR